MAYIAAAAIQTRVSEVLKEAAGTLRTITAGTYLGTPEGEGDMDSARGAVEKALIQARPIATRRSKASPPIYSNLVLYEQEWRIRVIRLLSRTTQIDDDARDAATALAALDCDVLRQALEFPGNLSTTTAGTPTGIVSGMMTYVDSTHDVRGPVDDGASIIETDHRFTCVLRATPATS